MAALERFYFVLFCFNLLCFIVLYSIFYFKNGVPAGDIEASASGGWVESVCMLRARWEAFGAEA